jgi:hypothetical protein
MVAPTTLKVTKEQPFAPPARRGLWLSATEIDHALWVLAGLMF